MTQKFRDFWDKFRASKKMQFFAICIVALLCVLAVFPFKTKADKSSENSTEEISSVAEYAQTIENKLENVLSKISGVGGVAVIVTLDGDFTYEYATDTETKTTVQGGTEMTITTETVIMVSGEPVVVRKIFPQIKGVMIVAEGAKNFAIKMDIMDAVETVLDIDRDKIMILS